MNIDRNDKNNYNYNYNYSNDDDDDDQILVGKHWSKNSVGIRLTTPRVAKNEKSHRHFPVRTKN